MNANDVVARKDDLVHALLQLTTHKVKEEERKSVKKEQRSSLTEGGVAKVYTVRNGSR